VVAVRAWLSYLLLVFGGGALLAPPLYWFVAWAAGEWPALEVLAQHPFHRFVNRSMLVLALVGLWPLLARLELRSWTGVGWGRPAGRGRQFGAGAALGLASVFLTALLVVAGGRRVGRGDLQLLELAGHLVGAAVSAGMVAALEETLFRGALQGGLRRTLGTAGAILVGAVAYASLHFLARVRWEAPVAWDSGLMVFVRMLAGFADWRAVVPGFLNLVVAGLVLGFAFEQTGSLWFPAGLHAGCVFGTKLFAAVTREIPEHAPWLYGSGRLLDGWAASVPLLLSLVLLPLALRAARPRVVP
jgi:membrane protease YdiL (CAAX protease family)